MATDYSIQVKLQLTPAYRPGQVLETVPGLIVIGSANP
jgi:hypothetical protein